METSTFSAQCDSRSTTFYENTFLTIHLYQRAIQWNVLFKWKGAFCCFVADKTQMFTISTGVFKKINCSFLFSSPALCQCQEVSLQKNVNHFEQPFHQAPPVADQCLPTFLNVYLIQRRILCALRFQNNRCEIITYPGSARDGDVRQSDPAISTKTPQKVFLLFVI